MQIYLIHLCGIKTGIATLEIFLIKLNVYLLFEPIISFRSIHCTKYICAFKYENIHNILEIRLNWKQPKYIPNFGKRLCEYKYHGNCICGILHGKQSTTDTYSNLNE